jgi:putative DNA primase/helicase
VTLVKQPVKQPESSPINAPDGLHLNSLGNADRFLRDYGQDFRWVQGRGSSAGTFFWWNGMRWCEDNPQANQMAVQTVRDLRKLYLMATKQNYPSQEIEEYVNFWNKSEAAYKVGEILTLARSRIVIDRVAFDSDVELFGVENGVVDLRDCSFRAPTREDLITKQANVSFDPDATCPLWDSFLLETTRNDLELIRYLQQCVGITLTGNQKEHLFFIIVGQGGTGKTSFCEALKFMFGEYACGIDPNSLGAGKVEGGRARPDLAKLHGVRLVLANESRAGLKLDEGLVKAITGGDTWTGRFLFENEFDYKPAFKLWLRTNSEPVFDGADSGMQRRIKKLPFYNVVKKHKAEDTELPTKLKAEAAGILNWGIKGLQDYQKNGLIEPAIVRQVTADYIHSLDTIGNFIDERCVRGAEYKVPANTLYTDYVVWMHGRNAQPIGDKRFKSDLGARGIDSKRTNQGSQFVGLKIASHMYDEKVLEA